MDIVQGLSNGSWSRAVGKGRVVCHMAFNHQEIEFPTDQLTDLAASKVVETNSVVTQRLCN